MKNITLTADEHLIERARETARLQHTTLNQMFRDCLSELAARQSRVGEFHALLDDISRSGVQAGRRFTREEMNER